ncbi:hypothetical protein BJF92_20755 [Rhizobium rhizosphaerae]|uniref:Uncharacterized protein n=2 Tax=Xaviernesmea rhizosphaerae TaxID=1672749 RepID=A0A1Q9AD00_9HYPH|nr:hypothetical protein BJF92_20755 [Xaviernesmea rhizosphaerae]
MRKTAIVICLAWAALLLASGAKAAEMRNLVVLKQELMPRPAPLIAGVGVHFGIGGEHHYEMKPAAQRLDELGVDSYRDDLPWPDFELWSRTPAASHLARLFSFMQMTTKRPLLILGHGNPMLPNADPPLNDPARRAFSDFAVRAVRATHGFDPIYEIWNEWNLRFTFTPPWIIGAGGPDDPRAAVHYVDLVRTVLPDLRKAAPEATLLAGAVGVDQDWQWTRAIASGLEAPLSVHVYNHCEPDESRRTATDVIDRLETLQAMLSAKGGPQPLYLTEFGWPTARSPCVISREAQADNVAQVLFWSAATPWLKGAWVYELKDQDRNPDALEANFGLYDVDGAPKPAVCAVREAVALIKQADGFKLERPFPHVFVLTMGGPFGLRIVSWTTSPAFSASLALEEEATVRARSLCAAQLQDARRFALGPRPLILDLPPDRQEVRLVVQE